MGRMNPTETQVYPWEAPPQFIWYKQVLMWVSPTLYERGGTNRVARGCYKMVTIAMDKDMMSSKTIPTEAHNSEGRFGDITEEPL
jgi:hypothetical protein